MRKKFKQFINEDKTPGLFSARVDYHRDGKSVPITGDWQDVEFDDLQTVEDIAKRVKDGDDVGFITKICQDKIAYPGHPHTFHPHDYTIKSGGDNMIKIWIDYDLYDPDHRHHFDRHDQRALLTFMERAE